MVGKTKATLAVEEVKMELRSKIKTILSKQLAAWGHGGSTSSQDDPNK